MHSYAPKTTQWFKRKKMNKDEAHNCFKVNKKIRVGLRFSNQGHVKLYLERYTKEM